MVRKSSDSNPSHVSRGGVLMHLGFSKEEALEVRVKSEIYRELLEYIRDRGLSQKQLCETLGLHQPEVSNLLNGRASKFSVGKLIKLAGKLDLGAKVRLVRPAASTTTTDTARARKATSSAA